MSCYSTAQFIKENYNYVKWSELITLNKCKEFLVCDNSIIHRDIQNTSGKFCFLFILLGYIFFLIADNMTITIHRCVSVPTQKQILKDQLLYFLPIVAAVHSYVLENFVCVCLLIYRLAP